MENDIRNMLLGVKPPRPEQETQATKEGLKEIAGQVPLLKQIIGVPKEDEADNAYVKGLVETFYRIYKVLKENGSETILIGLNMKNLKEVDDILSKNTTTIEGEYPQLVGADVENMGAFGAGVYAAFGLVENVLSKMPPETEEPEEAKPAEPKEDKTTLSALQDALAEVPNEEEPEPEEKPMAKKASGHSQNCHEPVVLIRVRLEDDEWKISVSTPANFACVANMARVVERLFGKKAAAKAQMMTVHGQLAALFAMEGSRE